jgi:hypothetical protein
MTTTFVANKMYGEVVEKVGMSPFSDNARYSE